MSHDPQEEEEGVCLRRRKYVEGNSTISSKHKQKALREAQFENMLLSLSDPLVNSPSPVCIRSSQQEGDPLLCTAFLRRRATNNRRRGRGRRGQEEALIIDHVQCGRLRLRSTYTVLASVYIFVINNTRSGGQWQSLTQSGGGRRRRQSIGSRGGGPLSLAPTIPIFHSTKEKSRPGAVSPRVNFRAAAR